MKSQKQGTFQFYFNRFKIKFFLSDSFFNGFSFTYFDVLRQAMGDLCVKLRRP